MNKKGVFGLSSVQAFFTIILGIALLAYVIIVIMGTLSQSTILTANSQSTRANNETLTTVDEVGETLVANGVDAPICTVHQCVNATAGLLISSSNYSVTGCTVKFTNTGGGGVNGTNWQCTYTYTWSMSREQTKSLLANTSTGITSFFGGISSVYAILAILVIILVLVVLVRVVTGGSGGSVGSSGGRAMESPGVI